MGYRRLVALLQNHVSEVWQPLDRLDALLVGCALGPVEMLTVSVCGGGPVEVLTVSGGEDQRDRESESP